MVGSDDGITEALAGVAAGDAAVEAELWNRIYPRLSAIARRRLARRDRKGSLVTSDLVHEGYRRLMQQDNAPHNRQQLFALFARLVERVLVDAARRRLADRRGGGRKGLSLAEVGIGALGPSIEVLALHEALDRLAALHPRAAQVVRLHCFAGRTIEEAAQELRVSTRTIDLDWAAARKWLARELGKGGDDGAAAASKRD